MRCPNQISQKKKLNHPNVFAGEGETFISIFERELAPLAAVQVAGLEESEEEEGTFTKSLESCNNKVMGGLMLSLEAMA